MSVRRSPTKGTIKNADSDGSKASPVAFARKDPVELCSSDSDASQVTFRKRKHGEDLGTRFDDFEKKMMSIFTEMTQMQSSKLNAISQDVLAIKNQLDTIKTTTDQLAVQQDSLKNELKSLTDFNEKTEQKIKIIENDIQELKESSTSNAPIISQCEDVISEIHERSLREKNLIITGIQEISSKNVEDRRNHDHNEVSKTIKLIDSNSAEPIKIFRLGKYIEGKSRPMKACFASAETTKSILRNKSVLKDKVRIYSDDTPQQKKIMTDLRDELKRRIEGGENDITIKFIKGIPRITKVQPKNQPE